MPNANFTAGWQRAMEWAMVKALKEGVITRRFTVHDLDAYYATQHTKKYGSLPELHANPATTARVYDRSKVVR